MHLQSVQWLHARDLRGLLHSCLPCRTINPCSSVRMSACSRCGAACLCMRDDPISGLEPCILRSWPRGSLRRLGREQLALGQLHWSAARYAPLQERALWDGLAAMYEQVP